MISAIAAMSVNGVIGVNNKLPWHIPEDLKHFKRLTKDKTMIMGRKTYDSLPDVVKQRECVVVSRNPKYGIAFDDLIDNLDPNKEYIVIGGGEIYKLFNDYVDTLYLTVVNHLFKGDTRFEFNLNEFVLVESPELHTENYHLTFETWYRIYE